MTNEPLPMWARPPGTPMGSQFGALEMSPSHDVDYSLAPRPEDVTRQSGPSINEEDIQYAWETQPPPGFNIPMNQPSVEQGKPVSEWGILDHITAPFKALGSGFYQHAALDADRFEKVSSALTKKAMKMFPGTSEDAWTKHFGEKLSENWNYWAAKLDQGGTPGFVGELLRGIGGFFWEIPQIMSLGGPGPGAPRMIGASEPIQTAAKELFTGLGRPLAVHGALKGGVDEGVPGAVKGAVSGTFMHSGLGALSKLAVGLPKRLAAYFMFGTATGAPITETNVRERMKSGLEMMVLGAAEGKKSPSKFDVNMRDVLDRWPKIADKVTDKYITGKLQKAIMAEDPSGKMWEMEKDNIKEAGARNVINEYYRLKGMEMDAVLKDLGGWVPEWDAKDAEMSTKKPIEFVNVKTWLEKSGVESTPEQRKAMVKEWTEDQYVGKTPLEYDQLSKNINDGLKTETTRQIESWWRQNDPTFETAKEIEAPRTDLEMRYLNAGVPIKSALTRTALKLQDVLQIEPRFNRIGASATGTALKRIPGVRDYFLEKAKAPLRELTKYNLDNESYGKLTFLVASEKKYGELSATDKKTLGPAVKLVSKFFKDHDAILKKNKVYEEGWPNSLKRMLKERKIDINDRIKVLKDDGKYTKAKQKEFEGKLQEAQDTLDFLEDNGIQYVHIPSSWLENMFINNMDRSTKIFSELFKDRKNYDIEALARYLLQPRVELKKHMEGDKEIVGKEVTLSKYNESPKMQEIGIEKRLDAHILPKDVDIRRIMGSYAHKVGLKVAMAKVFAEAKKDGLILPENDNRAKDFGWLDRKSYPSLKGMKAHPVLVEYMKEQFTTKGLKHDKNIGKILGTVKLLQFWNPIFLPAYDVMQGWWTGSIQHAITHPKEIGRAVRSVMQTKESGPANIMRSIFKSFKESDQDYWDAMMNGAFSTPWTPGHKQWNKQMDELIEGYSFKNATKRHAKNALYTLAWDSAWTGDNIIRMITYKNYIRKGKTPSEAGQLTARAHGDYASVPAQTRHFLNKLMFTPSFKIAMMSAQSEMIKSTGKLLTKAATKNKNISISEHEKSMAKMLPWLASGFILRGATMKALGFKPDQWGLKYTKTITDDDGNEKELVLHAATPDNVFLRYYHRFAKLDWLTKGGDVGAKLLSRAKWELHPLWQLGMELMSNKSTSFDTIWDPTMRTDQIGQSIVKYTAKRVYKVLELFVGASGKAEKGDASRMAARKALNNDMGNLGRIMNLFTLPYMRNPKNERDYYEARQIQNEFKKFMNLNPAISDKEYEERYAKLMRRLEKVYGKEWLEGK